MLLVCLQKDKIEDLESHNQIMKFADGQRQSARFLRDEKMSDAFLHFINRSERPIIFFGIFAFLENRRDTCCLNSSKLKDQKKMRGSVTLYVAIKTGVWYHHLIVTNGKG